MNKLIILAMVENVNESYVNIKTLLDLISTDSSADCMYAFDMKLANVFFGLSTATSTYPCP